MPEDHIEIPATALVHCQQVQFKLVRVAGCVGCAHFAGLSDRFPGSEAGFAQRYAVLCKPAEPIRRDIKELAE